MEDFEKLLTEISKPEVKMLKHQNLLADRIMRTKNRNAMSIWWLLIPLYVIATFSMKTSYMKTSLKKEINLFKAHSPLLSFLLFLLFPALIIIVNAFFTAKCPRTGMILIILSAIILFIYILTYYV